MSRKVPVAKSALRNKMGQIRKIGDVYYIEFYARGLLYSQVAGGDLKAAQDLLAKTEGTIASGEALTIVREIDLAAFYERFLQDAANQYQAATLKRFQALIRHLDGFLHTEFPKITKLSQINPQIMEAYKANLQRNVKPKIINLTFLLLREMLEYGIKIGFINDNPTLHVRLLAVTGLRDCPLTERYKLAQTLFAQGLTIGRITLLLKISDVGKLMYYRKLIPLNRQDMYN